MMTRTASAIMMRQFYEQVNVNVNIQDHER